VCLEHAEELTRYLEEGPKQLGGHLIPGGELGDEFDGVSLHHFGVEEPRTHLNRRDRLSRSFMTRADAMASGPETITPVMPFRWTSRPATPTLEKARFASVFFITLNDIPFFSSSRRSRLTSDTFVPRNSVMTTKGTPPVFATKFLTISAFSVRFMGSP